MNNAGFDFYRTSIPPEVIALVPESVVRENTVMPVRGDEYAVVIAVADLSDRELWDKLEFILNRSVTRIFATRRAILFAIEKYYPSR